MINLTASDIDEISTLMRRVIDRDNSKARLTIDKNDNPVLTGLNVKEFNRLLERGYSSCGYRWNSEKELWEIGN